MRLTSRSLFNVGETPAPNRTHFAAILELFRPEYLVVPSGDFLLNGLLINRHLRRSLRRLQGADFILHNLAQAYPSWGPKDRLWRTLDRLAIDWAGRFRIHTVDPYATQPERHRRLSVLGTSVLPLPHPYEKLTTRSASGARQRLGLPSDVRLLASLGDLTVRKGTDLLIRSFCELDSTELALVLYGVLSEEIRRMLADRGAWLRNGRIRVRDEFISEADFEDVLYAVDGLWVGYPRQIGMASLLLYAADVQRPVLASEFGCVGWMAREYGMGRTFCPSMDEACEALRWFSSATDFEPSVEGAQRLLAYHSLEGFEHRITSGLPTSMPAAAIHS